MWICWRKGWKVEEVELLIEENEGLREAAEGETVIDKGEEKVSYWWYKQDLEDVGDGYLVSWRESMWWLLWWIYTSSVFISILFNKIY